MKNKLSILLIALFAVFTINTFAQTPPPGGMGVVTPTPTATPTGLSIGAVTSSKTVHFNVTTAQIVALGAATSGDVTLFSLPARSVVVRTIVKPYVAVAGTSYSAATARVITAAHNFGTAYDVFQAVGETVEDIGYIPTFELTTVAVPVLLHMTSTGGNLSACTAGSIDVWVTYETLQ